MAAGAVALLLAGAVTVYRHRPEPHDGPAVAATDRPVAAATVPGLDASMAPGQSEPVRTPGGALRVRYGFDGGLAGAVPDEERHQPLRASAAAGGVLTTERRDGGLAVRFPPPCPKYGDASCPRAILESGRTDLLNPGAGPLRFGAAVRLTDRETAKGENVLQKGYSQGDSQFKLQVDGLAGRPGCVLVGTGSPEIHVLTAAASVADGRWHIVECVRAGAALTIVVDGAVGGRRKVPAGLSIVNKEPLRIGGKGTGPNNDQFHGAVDDVFVAIGA